MPPFWVAMKQKEKKKTNIGKIMRTEIYNWSLILIKLEETRTTNENCFHPQIENSNWP